MWIDMSGSLVVWIIFFWFTIYFKWLKREHFQRTRIEKLYWKQLNGVFYHLGSGRLSQEVCSREVYSWFADRVKFLKFRKISNFFSNPEISEIFWKFLKTPETPKFHKNPEMVSKYLKFLDL
jgi:hypothetical protein